MVPKEVLEAIQGKEVQIVLDMGSYSWTIGGTEVAAAELKDIDLEVKADTGGVPTLRSISAIPGGRRRKNFGQ